nr:MAG TPA: hypothetical protein [Caudoviricetes sp.]
MIIYQIVYKVLDEGFEKVYSTRVYENYDDAYSTLLKMSENDLEDYPHDIFIKQLELIS